jgi:hypothetical protein
MAKAFYIFLFISLMLSCKSGTKQAVDDSAKIIVDTALLSTSSAEVAQKFKPFIEGIWVKQSYIDALEKTKSPYKSRKSLGGVALMMIDFKSVNADKLTIGYSLGNHEGASFDLFFKTGQTTNSLKTDLKDYGVKSDYFELGYVVNNKDTSVVLFHYNEAQKLINKTLYIKVANKASNANDLGWGIEFITNKQLITGRYKTTDINATVTDVEFDINGDVSGFPNFNSYYISTDFAAGSENNLDMIIFDPSATQEKSYTYKISADTLKLFYTKSNADHTELMIGELAYILIKKKQ